MIKKNLQLAKDLLEKTLVLMGMKEAKVKASPEEEAIRLDIDYPDSGLLIGNHGETIESLQLIIALMFYKKTGSWKRLIVNIGDYLEKKTENLKTMALNCAQKVKFSQAPVMMPILSSAERRIIHLALVDHPDVSTESQGEGRDRRLIIKPKK